MKFNDGYWLLREGVTARYATEALDVGTTPQGASLAVLTRRVEDRGSVLNAPTITVELAAPPPARGKARGACPTAQTTAVGLPAPAPGLTWGRASHFVPVGPETVAFELTP